MDSINVMIIAYFSTLLGILTAYGLYALCKYNKCCEKQKTIDDLLTMYNNTLLQDFYKEENKSIPLLSNDINRTDQK